MKKWWKSKQEKKVSIKTESVVITEHLFGGESKKTKIEG